WLGGAGRHRLPCAVGTDREGRRYGGVRRRRDRWRCAVRFLHLHLEGRLQVIAPSARWSRWNHGTDERLSLGVSVIQQAKMQAQVLGPLVKALQAELGEERAYALVRRALGDVYRRYGREFWRTKNEKNLGKIMASAFATYANEDALDYNVIEHSEDAVEVD